MKKAYLGLAVLYMIFLTAIGYQASHAFFLDSATSMSNTFSAASEFATPSITVTPTGTESPTVATTGAIVINEVSPIGGLTQDWIELYNPTSSPIDVSGWDIVDNTTFDILPASPPIPAGGYAVIVASGSAVSVPGSAIKIELSISSPGSPTTIGNSLNEDGDRVRLRDFADTEIDAVSYGSDLTVFTLPVPTLGQSLRRIPNGTDTNAAADWQNGSQSIGVTN